MHARGSVALDDPARIGDCPNIAIFIQYHRRFLLHKHPPDRDSLLGVFSDVTGTETFSRLRPRLR